MTGGAQGLGLVMSRALVLSGANVALVSVLDGRTSTVFGLNPIQSKVNRSGDFKDPIQSNVTI